MSGENMNKYMRCHKTLKEIGFSRPSLVQLAFLVSLGKTEKNLAYVAADLNIKACKLKYTLGTLASRGLVSAKVGYLAASSTWLDVHKKTLPSFINGIDTPINYGVRSFYALATLDEINNLDNATIPQLSKALELPMGTVYYCIKRLEEEGLVMFSPMYQNYSTTHEGKQALNI